MFWHSLLQLLNSQCLRVGLVSRGALASHQTAVSLCKGSLWPAFVGVPPGCCCSCRVESAAEPAPQELMPDAEREFPRWVSMQQVGGIPPPAPTFLVLSVSHAVDELCLLPSPRASPCPRLGVRHVSPLLSSLPLLVPTFSHFFFWAGRGSFALRYQLIQGGFY